LTVSVSSLPDTLTTADPDTVGAVVVIVKALDRAVIFASPEITGVPMLNVSGFAVAVRLTVVVTVGITLVISNGSAATTSIILPAEIFILPIAKVNGFALIPMCAFKGTVLAKGISEKPEAPKNMVTLLV
tara:strand:+ start:98 stop:487 length:390 start_codon:yes stop_codon:yes gene_type:complete